MLPVFEESVGSGSLREKWVMNNDSMQHCYKRELCNQCMISDSIINRDINKILR